MRAFVELLATGRIDVEGLMLDRLPIDDAPFAYERLAANHSSPLGIVVQYAPTELSNLPRCRAAAARAHTHRRAFHR